MAGGAPVNHHCGGQLSRGEEVSQDEVVARATLTYLAEPGDGRLVRLVADRGAEIV